MGKTMYKVRVDLDLSEIDKAAIRKAATPEALKAYAEEVKKWKADSQKGDAPEAPKSELIGGVESFCNLFEQAVGRQHGQTDRHVLRLCKDIAIKFKKSIEFKHYFSFKRV